jgi:predicted RNA polymerase sigma factor
VVALNRAIAVGELQGPAAALALELDHYGPFHATRAGLLGRLGRHREAVPSRKWPVNSDSARPARWLGCARLSSAVPVAPVVLPPGW